MKSFSRKLVFTTVYCVIVSLSILVSKARAKEVKLTDQDVLDVVKEELQQVNKQLAEKIILESGRRRRAASKSHYELEIDYGNSFTVAAPLETEVFAFRCQDELFMIKSNGIYRMEGIPRNQSSKIPDEYDEKPKLTKVSDLVINSGDRILDMIEWERKCFLLIATKNNTFSSLYTLHGRTMIPVLRQQIRNYGFVVAAKFFANTIKLYLIIINDNAVHSLTICPLFRWAGTYMDEIHAIQTRGASAVVTFMIGGKFHIAIAQSQDSTGNYEVGTVVLSFDSWEQLEKLQVLWSYHPVSLEYMSINSLHFLVIGMAKESSIMYFFGGIDFIYWQSLDGLMGDKLLLREITFSNRAPFLLAATPNAVKLYYKSAFSTIFTVNLDASQLLLKPHEKIDDINLIRIGPLEYYMAVFKSLSGTRYCSIFYLQLYIKKLDDIKETESKLTQCLTNLRTKLDSEVGVVKEYQTQIDSILSVDKDIAFPGSIICESEVTTDAEKTHIGVTNISPTSSYAEYNSETLPSKISEYINDTSKRLHDDVLGRLHEVVMKSQPRNISGNFVFLDVLSANRLYGHSTNLKFFSVNGRDWQEFEEYALFANHSEEQVITGKWEINELTANSVDVRKLSGIDPNDFLRRNCPEDRIQVIQGAVKFEADAFLEGNVVILPEVEINGIPFADIVMKNDTVTEIRGFKHTKNLSGGEGFIFSFINGKNYIEWYSTIAHTTGSPQHLSGRVVINGKKPNTFRRLSLSSVNLVDWVEFTRTVVVNGKDQFIAGDLILQKGIFDAVITETIEGFHFVDFLNAAGDQVIYRTLTADFIDFKKSIRTHTVNGKVISEIAVLKDEDATITGPITLSYCVAKASLVVPEGILIGGQDVSELAKSRIKHIYYTKRDSDTVIFKRNVEANSLTTNNINEYSWETLRSGVWSKDGPNIVPGPLELRGKKVFVLGNFQTGTLNSVELEKDVVQLKNPDVIYGRVFFAGDVYVSGNIYHSAGKYVAGLDIAKSISGIVRKDDNIVVTGKKHFLGNINAERGITTEHLNGIDVLKDVVFLNGPVDGGPQLVFGTKYFKSTVQMTDMTTSGNIVINGTVNGYNLYAVLTNSVTKTDFQEGTHIRGNLHFNNSLYGRTLYVDKFNGIDISDFLDKVIYLNVPGEIYFPILLYGGRVDFEKQANVTYINDTIVRDFLSKVVLVNEDHNYRINGTKVFKNASFDNINCVEFNGINVQEISEYALLRSGPQNVTGKMYFSHVKVEGYKLETPGIGDIPVELFITTREEDPCEIYFDVIFAGESVKVEEEFKVKSLNGYQVEEISAGYEKGLGNRTFSSVEIKGDIEWQTASYNSYQNLGALSKLLDKAVTLDEDQTITGKVEFLAGITAENVTTETWINAINLSKLIADSMNPENLEEATISGENIFTRPIHIDKFTSIEELEVATVNGVDLKELHKIAVRKNSTGLIYGTKLFLDEVDVQNLTFDDFMKQGDLKDLATVGDSRVVDVAEFDDIFISGNLNFIFSTKLDLHYLLQNRVSKTKEQTLHGSYTFSSLNVNGTCSPITINDIPVQDIYINKAGQASQYIYGEKTFVDGVHVKGEMKTADVNGYNFAALHSDVYRRNEPEKLNRPIVFVNPVIIDSKIKVEKKINNYDYHKLSERFSKALKDVEIRATNYTPFGRTHFEKFQQLQRLATNQKPFWLEYLRSVERTDGKIPKLGPAVRIEQTETNDGVLLSLYSRISSDNSSFINNLPRGCYCNKVQFILFKYNSLIDVESRTAICASQFVVSTPSGRVFTVRDDGTSYNTTCTETKNPSQLVIANGTNVGMLIPGSEILIEASLGFLVDVSAFTASGIDYVALAYAYPDLTRHHPEGRLVIYEVNRGTGRKIQTIDGISPNRIAIDEFQDNWLLSVAGSEKPNAFCNSTSSIYIWSSSKKQFDLLRDLKTEGANDVTFLSVEDLSSDGKNLSFVAFAQEISGVESGGEVIIYSYSYDSGNYIPFDVLHFQWKVTAVESTCIMEECYILVVIPQEGVHFYKYQYVEGFELFLSVPVKETYDITPYVLHHRLFYGLAGIPRSFLAEGQIAGVNYFK